MVSMNSRRAKSHQQLTPDFYDAFALSMLSRCFSSESESEFASKKKSQQHFLAMIFIIRQDAQRMRRGGGESLFKFCVDSVDVFLANESARHFFGLCQKSMRKKKKKIYWLRSRAALIHGRESSSIETSRD